MKAVINTSDNLSVDFEFKTYSFAKGSLVLVDDVLYDHLQEIYPMIFNFHPPKSKTPIKKVAWKETPARYKAPATNDMVVKAFRPQVDTFGTPVSEALVGDEEFEGPGVETETI